MIGVMNPDLTPLEEADMWLRAAVAAGGHLEHWEQDELVDRFRLEVECAAAERIRAAEARRFPGPLYGAIRRMRAAYYAGLIAEEDSR